MKKNLNQLLWSTLLLVAGGSLPMSAQEAMEREPMQTGG